jgi:UDP-4-amino-4,6-dideoxy-N-acetyl-beta-L-altrosamine transaminase
MIPYGRQEITEKDIESVVDVLRSDFLTQGSVVPKFEHKLCEYTGAENAIAVNSCTSALHIACLALNLGPGDILWTSPISFVASANCGLYCGASVDFVDIDPNTALLSIKKLEEKLQYAKKKGKLPKIVIPVHFGGQPCDMKEIYALSKKYNFKIIEDAAHAIGAKYQDKLIGSCQYSDITVFSFHPVKIITTGEGGVAMTNNLQLSDRMRLLRSHGITRDVSKMKNKPDGAWYYEQIDLGFNYRMTDIQAALGISQLNRIEQYVSRRNEIAEWYNKKFRTTDISPLMQKMGRSSAYHLYVILIKGGRQQRDVLYNYLLKNDIGVNLHYIPVYKHPFFNKNSCLENAEYYYKHAISLPIYPTISSKDLNKVVDKILCYI